MDSFIWSSTPAELADGSHQHSKHKHEQDGMRRDEILMPQTDDNANHNFHNHFHQHQGYHFL